MNRDKFEHALRALFTPGIPENRYSALSVPDIVASKLYVGREKDYSFIEGLAQEILSELPDDPETKKAKLVWRERYLPQLTTTKQKSPKRNHP